MTNPDSNTQQSPWFFAIACVPVAFVGAVALVVNDIDFERKNTRFSALPVEKSLKSVDECAVTSKRRSTLSCYYKSALHKDALADSFKVIYANAGWKLLDDATVAGDGQDRGLRTLTFCQKDESVRVEFAGEVKKTEANVVVSLLEYPACT
jgi:hypothetical protein